MLPAWPRTSPQAGETARPYAKAYLEPGPANAAYHTQKEVTLELFKTFTTGIETVRDQKMAKALGPKSAAGKAAACPFWRSEPELRQHGGQSRERARAVRQGRLRASGA
jgi:predicted lipoprotein